MKIFKLFSRLSVFLFFFNPTAFYGQTICTNYTVTPGTTISASGTSTYNTNINVPDSYVLTDVNITINISHTRNDNLDIFLISPLGTIVELSTDNGGPGDNYNNVTFDDASTNILPSNNTTISGTYQPEGSLASFNGQNSNGTWVLRVTDDSNGNGGTINSITLNLCYTNFGHLGPGGVGNATTNVLWLKGDGGAFTDAGITQATNGQPIRQWNDASGNNRHATQATLGNRPLFETASDNGMPALRFTGDTYIDSPALGITGTSSYTYIMTFRDTTTELGTITDGAGHFILDRTTTTNELVSLKPITGNVYGYQKRNNAGGALGGPLTTTNINTNGKIIEMRRDYNVNYQLFYNNNLQSTLADADGATTPPNPRIGRHATTPNGGLRGFINEFIIYNFALNEAQTIIVNNYLSAKYNMPIASNDFYTRDNPGAAGNFDYNVAGIGQATDGSNHTDSQGSGIVRISNPSTLSNDEFLFWGEETPNPVYNFTTNPNNYTEQLNSRWRVSRRGNPGNVTVSFDISGVDLSGKQGCVSLQLVIDDSYDFSSPSNVYPLTIVGNTATATGVQLQNNRYFTLRYTDQIVWDGTNFFNGAGAGNAPNNTDSCLKLTVKSGTAANLVFDAHVREVEVEPGAILNIANGVLLETENQVVINGTLDLLGEAQLIQNHTGPSLNSGLGSLRIRQQGTTNAFNYNYWSAPVTRSGNWQIGYLEDAAGPLNFTAGINPNPATSPITLSSRWLYSFKGPSGDYNSWIKLSQTSNLAPGFGFSMKGSGRIAAEEEYIFRGIPNDGTYNIPVTAGTDFLTGNPYPSVLDANQFINDNLSVIDGSLYFWESFTTNNSHYLANYEGGYAIYNLLGVSLPAVADASGLTSGLGSAAKSAPTQYINIGQGFFTTITNSGNLTYNNAQRAFARESLGATVYYKTNNGKETIDDRPKLWFSFTAPKGQTKIIGLGYDTHATYDYDKGYDAKSYDNLKNDIYWLLNNETLAIQALPNLDIEDELPLELKISDAGLYKLSIDKMENVPSDVTIYLFDKNQNIYYNLRDTEAQLLLNKGTFDEFSIVFKAGQSLGITPVEDTKAFVSYDSNTKTLELQTKQALVDLDSFEIYNTLGQVVLSIKTPGSKSINVSNLPNGIYFLKVNTKYNENSKSIKFVKY
ncbi:MAG: hypothetical protein B7Z06_06060 [Flavobacteriales bacterium 32-35-8]|nr:MAG: hypothetical protein B7Z06_06060 [Flavobacteriales bacterium 32-35-8]